MSIPNESYCLACQTPIADDQLPLCLGCLLERHGTIHPNWTNRHYWEPFITPTVSASEARFLLREQERNRFSQKGPVLV